MNQSKVRAGRDGQGAAVDAVRLAASRSRTAVGTLGGVAVSEEKFTLAPGTRKELTVTLNGAPSSGYLYGALEVVGLPTDLGAAQGRRGRRPPGQPAALHAVSRRASSIKAGAVKVVGSGKTKALTLSVRNTGNTLDPVTGRREAQERAGDQERLGQRTRILPGKSVRLTLPLRQRAQARHLHGHDHADAGQEEDDRDEEGHGRR